ncbi:Origin recognition complex, subunit 5 [Pseudohyphozyma bogoriensis]|nr:Origin recognition complex, subunit 5 [Pseudohyphozyma bogoriensis]
MSSEEISTELLSQLDSLLPFVTSLSQALTASHPPASLHVHSSSPLARSIISTVLLLRENSYASTSNPIQSLLPRAAFVDLRTTHSTKQLFDTIANDLAAWPSNWSDKEGAVLNWDGRTNVKVVRKKSGAANGRGKKRARRDDDEDVDRAEDEEEEEVVVVEPAPTLQWSQTLPAKPQIAHVQSSPDHFIALLSTVFSLGSPPPEDSSWPSMRRFIVIDNAELLHDLAAPGNVGGAPRETGLGMTLASVIYRLAELSALPITTILISSQSWTKARDAMVGLASPTLLTFPPLSSSDATKILTHRFSSSLSSTASSTLDAKSLSTLFSSLADVISSTFSSTIGTNLDELAYLCAKFWPKWLSCVEGPAQISHKDIPRLHQQIKSDLLAELSLLSAPHLSLATDTLPPPLLLGAPLPLSPTKSTTTPSLPTAALAKSLPVLSRLLLIASYYASYNPPKSDVRCFVKKDDEIAKKGTKAKRGSPKKVTVGGGKATVRAQLVGGKAFPIERLLAIFKSIAEDGEEAYAVHTIDVGMLVTTLVQLKLLTRVSAADKMMDGVKLKCRLTRDTVGMLAKSVKFSSWEDYLWDKHEF